MGMIFGPIADAFNSFLLRSMVNIGTQAVKLAVKAAISSYNQNDGTTAPEWEAEASRGDADAQCRLGCYYYENKKYEIALYWLEKSARQGHAQAKNILSHLQ